MNTGLDFLGKRFNMAPRAHRRWLVVVIYAAFALWLLGFLLGSRWMGVVTTLVGFVALLVFAGFAGTGYEEGDEREVHRRDHAFYLAHRKMNWALVVALFMAWFQWPQNPLLAAAGPELSRILQQLPYAALFAVIGLNATLPQAILLWTEPDVEELG
jgi:hypothetical protein